MPVRSEPLEGEAEGHAFELDLVLGRRRFAAELALVRCTSDGSRSIRSSSVRFTSR